MPDDRSLADFVASVAATNLPPSGGAVSAHTAALSSALTQMVSAITIGRKRFASVDAEMRVVVARAAELVATLSALADRDAAACAAMHAAYKLPADTEQRTAERSRAIAAAMLTASEVPLEIARRSAEACALAAIAAEKGNPNALADATVAALLAEASCRGAAYTVRMNVGVLGDRALATRYAEEAIALVRQAARSASRATAQAERAIGADPEAPPAPPPR
ncbi:MAG: cyclodeaminase/cyclohydrolase family protein [Gemmatimonadaceae bacterium]